MTTPRVTRFARQTLFAAGFTLFGGALAAAGGAIAGPGGPDDHGGSSGHFVRLMDDLDLNTDQKAKLAVVKAEAKQTFADHRAERRADSAELVGLIRADKLTRAVVHQRIDAKLAVMKDGMHELGDELFDVYESLTLVQRGTLADRMETHAAHEGDRSPRGGHRGDR